MEVKNDYLLINHKRIYVQQILVNDELVLPTLVFLHEGLGCVAMWKDFPEALCCATGLNGVVYDRQGYGKSDPVRLPREKDYLEKEALVYLRGLLQELQVTNPILIGHSDGGTIALIYAAHFPETVAVITEAAHVLVEEVTLRGIEEALPRIRQAQTLEKLRYYHGDKIDVLLAAWTETWLSDWFRDWNISEILSRITCPSLLIQGADDEYATPSHLFLIAEKIGPPAKPILLEHCGHIPHLQSGDTVLELMNHFVRSVFRPL